MAGEITAGVRLTLKDAFSRGLGAAAVNTEKFASGAMAAIRKVDSVFSGAAAKFAGFGLSLGLGAVTKELIDFDAEIVRMGVQAGISDGEIQNLKQSLFDTATDPDIKMGYNDMSAAMSEVIEMTGNMGFAEGNLRNMGLAMRATASDGKAIGGLFAEFEKMKLGTEDIAIAMDTLATQGNNGAFTLANLAALGPRTINAYRAVGRDGVEALTEMGAALQVIRRGTGSSEQAATAFEAVMRNLTNPDKQKALRSMGVDVRDMEGKFRPVTDLMEEIVVKSNGSLEVLGSVFDAEAVRAFNSAIGEFQQTGMVKSFKEFETMIGDGSAMEEAAARNAKTLQANIQNLQSVFVKFASANLTKPLEKLAEYLNKLAENPEKIERIFKGIAIGLGAIATAKGISALANTVNSIQSFFGKRLTPPSVTSGGGAGIPVHVTNWGGAAGSSSLPGGPQGLSGASVGRTPNGQPAGTPLDRPRFGITGKQAAVTGGAAAVTAAFYAVPQMMQELDAIKQDETLTNKQRGKATGGAIGGAAGSIGGAAAGAIAGAAIGSVVPVVGTALGALAGGLIGYFGGKGGRLIGEKIGEAVAREDIPKILEDEINAVSQIPRGGGNPVLEGNAVMNVNVKVSDEQTRATVAIGNNNMPIRYDVGSATAVRRSPL